MLSRLSPKQGTEKTAVVDLLRPKKEDITAEEAFAFDPIELYLFQVEAKLLTLPPETRYAVLEEIRQHLHASVAAREELGMPSDAATQEAIHRFGNPANIARQFCRVWREEDTAFPRAAFSQAISWFGGLGGAFGVLAVLNVYAPNTSLIASINDWNYVALFFISPVIAGLAVGKRTPRRAAFGTLFALAALMALSIPLAWLDLTLRSPGSLFTPGFLPFLFTLWTLPGCLAASVTAAVVNFRQRKQRC